jgi:GxxExxY protein
VSQLKARGITDRILRAFYAVYNELGYGFLEKVYENAMAIESRQMDLRVGQQVPIKVEHDGHPVGDYFADLAVEHQVIVEIKAVEALCEAHVQQLIHYLKATDAEVGLLLNFGPEPQFARRVLSMQHRRPRASDPRQSATSAESANGSSREVDDVEDAYNEG